MAYRRASFPGMEAEWNDGKQQCMVYWVQPQFPFLTNISITISLRSASKERDSSRNHVISPNGYNLGRDWFVERAIEGRNYKGMWWKADLEWRVGLLAPGKKGQTLVIDSYPVFEYSDIFTSGVNHGIEQDGRVAVLTVIRV